MDKIKVLKPLKSSQALREEASQSTLAQPKIGWKPSAKSTWAMTPSAPEPDPIPAPAAPQASEPIAYTAPDAVPIAPAAPAAPQFMTGSTFAVTKMPLPKGIYVIVALNIIDLVLSLFRTTDNSVLFTIVMFFDLMVAIGLLLKLELARKLLIVLAVATVILAAVDAVGLLGLQDRVKVQEARYNQAVSQIDPTRLSVTQREVLATQRTQIDALKKRLGHVTNVALVGLGVTTAVSVAQVVYVTRPKVRGVFETLKT